MRRSGAGWPSIGASEYLRASPRARSRERDPPGEALRRRHALARELRAPTGVAERLRNLDLRGVEEDLLWLSGSRRRLLWIGHGDYPRLLSEVPDPPPVLFVEGDPESLAWPMLAIVGKPQRLRHGA